MPAAAHAISRNAGLAVAAILAASAWTLWLMGRVAVCACGYVQLWEGEVLSSGNSQHLSDWYSPSHIIHGFIFYWFLWLVARHWSFGRRLAVATLVEAAWEIFENTPFIINRYREATISLDYYGDSVLNSVSDMLMMVAGFVLASRLPVWATVAIAAALELYVGWMIRDNLTLNIIMLLWPLDAIRQWQAAA
jgi:hypothetical protein